MSSLAIGDAEIQDLGFPPLTGEHVFEEGNRGFGAGGPVPLQQALLCTFTTPNSSSICLKAQTSFFISKYCLLQSIYLLA